LANRVDKIRKSRLSFSHSFANAVFYDPAFQIIRVFLAGGLITHIIGFQNDRAIYLLRVNYSDQRNNKPRIFNSGGTRCDRYCPYHGTLCLCAKHGFGDRQRGAISNGVN
jgi:hypothetical protein